MNSYIYYVVFSFYLFIYIYIIPDLLILCYMCVSFYRCCCYLIVSCCLYYYELLCVFCMLFSLLVYNMFVVVLDVS